MRLCLQCKATYANNSWKCVSCNATPTFTNGYPSFAPELSSDSGFKDEYFSELVQLEERNFWFQARNKLILWALSRYFPHAKNFMEIGCGTGFVLSSIRSTRSDIKLSGSEISSEGLGFAARRSPGVELFQMDARSIPFVEEFDVVGAFDVLEHINQDQLVIDQMYQSIKHGGGILLTVPQHDFLWSRTDVHACHVRRYSKKDLLSKVQAAGFTLIRSTSFVSILLPLMMLARMNKPKVEHEYDPLQELRVGGIVNNILGKIMLLERKIIQAGVSFPAGGSLLIIARKE